MITDSPLFEDYDELIEGIEREEEMTGRSRRVKWRDELSDEDNLLFQVLYNLTLCMYGVGVGICVPQDHPNRDGDC